MIFLRPERKPENNSAPPLYRTGTCRDCEALNAKLRIRIAWLTESDFVQRHHFLEGRYENLYVPLELVPELRVILDLAVAQGADILKRPKKNLTLGWWLNLMQPGQRTLSHTHDHGDELLAGVYYIAVPPKSGSLVLTRADERAKVEPREGAFVYFRPDVQHEVTRNDSSQLRVSVGFNLGPAPV